MIRTVLAAACSIAAIAAPAAAENLEKLRPGEAIAIMPDGHMARTPVTDAKKLEVLMKGSKSIPWCYMLLAGPDGTVYFINTDTHNPMAICEDMVPEAQ